MTAAPKPGRREGGGALNCTRDLVRMEGGATRAAAVATWALVCCASMECVILLVSSLWVAGTLGGNCTLGTRGMLGVCTLRTHCMLGGSGKFCDVLKAVGLCLYMGFCCLYDELEVLCCLRISGAVVMPCSALMQSANACITCRRG